MTNTDIHLKELQPEAVPASLCSEELARVHLVHRTNAGSRLPLENHGRKERRRGDDSEPEGHRDRHRRESEEQRWSCFLLPILFRASAMGHLPMKDPIGLFLMADREFIQSISPSLGGLLLLSTGPDVCIKNGGKTTQNDPASFGNVHSSSLTDI